LVPLAFLGSVTVILGTAFVLEYGFDIAPCILCLYQRAAPTVVAVLAVVAAWPMVPARWARMLVGLIALAFVANAVLAGYHVGVEQHWWAGTDACGGAPTLSSNLADLRAGLEHPDVVPCDTVAWSFLGLSVAGYNMILSVLLAGAAVWAVRRPSLWRS